MEKTVKEWFEELEEPYKTQAFDNTEADMLECVAEALSDALFGAFSWECSNEGAEYWDEYVDNLIKQNK